MYTIKRYIEHTTLLASSLVIKHHDIGIVMNNGLVINNSATIPTDLRLWKYYLNLSGEKHTTNDDVKVKLVETGQVVSLTKLVMDNNPATRKELDSRLSSYKALLVDYPNDHIYINGCISPVNIDTAISAKDGDVLSYSKIYLEPQEYSLIREISGNISLFFDRWYIKEYNITDELYMASVLSVLHANIPNMIANIRMADATTSEANSFHVEHFFRSHLDSWDNVKNLKQATIWWLYRNMVVLMNNVGSNDTLDTVVNKIFTDNGIGLATYTLERSVHNLIDPADVTLSRYKRGSEIYNVKPLNRHYNPVNTYLTNTEMTSKEIQNNDVSVYTPSIVLDTLVKDTGDKLSIGVNIPQPTKVIDFGDIKLFKAYNNNLLEAILDTWLVLASTDKYAVSNTLIDPNTKVVYNLNTYTGIMLFYYLLLLRFGDPDPVLTEISYEHVIKPSVIKSDLTKGLLQATGTNYVADTILNILPTTGSVLHTVSDFSTLIQDQINMYSTVWQIDSGVNNNFLNANIKKMVSRLYDRGQVPITTPGVGINLAALLANNGIVVNITQLYDIDLTLIDLFKSFTGFDIKEEVVLQEMYAGYRGLFDKLTSYTLQTIAPNITPGGITTPYTAINVNNAPNGYIAVTDASVTKALEDNLGITTGDGNNYTPATKVSLGGVPGINNISLRNEVSLLGTVDLNTKGLAKTTIGSAYAQLLTSGYIEYGPGVETTAFGGVDSIVYATVADNPINNIRTFTTQNDVAASAANAVVSATTGTTAEILGSNYPK